MKQQLMRAAATAVLGIGLTTGFAAADTTINQTGHESDNKVITKVHNSARFDNDNNVRVRNNNDQDARSGRVSANENTTAGDVSSGNASNTNSSTTSISVNNSAGLGALASMGDSDLNLGDVTISNTGAESTNKVITSVSNRLTVDNDNNVRVTNNNDQDASSGRVSANENTTVGNVSSGNASNTSSSSTTISITN